MVVSAEVEETEWEIWDWVLLDEESLALGVDVEPLDPLDVSNFRGSPGDDLDVLEQSASLDVDEAELSEGSSQTDSGNDQEVGFLDLG